MQARTSLNRRQKLIYRQHFLRYCMYQLTVGAVHQYQAGPDEGGVGRVQRQLLQPEKSRSTALISLV